MRALINVCAGSCVVLGLLQGAAPLRAQRGRPAGLGDGPWTYKSGDMAYRAVIVTRGLVKPWSMAFLPDGNILITELGGRLRIVRSGVLAPAPIAGAPAAYATRLVGLMDIALHPKFADNKLVYITYTKQGPDLARGAEPVVTRVPNAVQQGGTGKTATTALWRARWDGNALVEGRDIFVADAWVDDSVSLTEASRIVFGRDGMLYMGIGTPNAPAAAGKYAQSRGGRAQDPGSHGGKFLRLKDDGTVPKDNPFVGKAGYKPEIYTMGHRNMLGLAVHPDTGAIWENENGPADGDEINILKPGANYGWPLVGYGRDYSGDFIGGPGAIGEIAGRKDANIPYLQGMEPAVSYWAPAVAPSGMTFYAGDQLPRWKGSLFVGIMKNQRLERFSFNEKGFISRPEWLLDDLKQRIRDVRQGPDGLLYLLTDEEAGALIRIEPTPARPTP
ncbi:MAG: PQQ-dependent sugar dehydrogenase [Acidobacteriota bacterium]